MIEPHAEKTAAQITKERCDFKEGSPQDFIEHEKICPSLHQDVIQCYSCLWLFKGKYRMLLHLEEKPTKLTTEEKKMIMNYGLAEVRKRKHGRALAARTLDYSKAGHPVLWVWGHRNTNEFEPADCFATEREKFIQMVCGKNLYYTEKGLYFGKLYGYRERKKGIYASQVPNLNYKLIKQGEYEFVTLR